MLPYLNEIKIEESKKTPLGIYSIPYVMDSTSKVVDLLSRSDIRDQKINQVLK